MRPSAEAATFHQNSDSSKRTLGSAMPSPIGKCTPAHPQLCVCVRARAFAVLSGLNELCKWGMKRATQRASNILLKVPQQRDRSSAH